MIAALSLSPAVDKIYWIDGFKAGGHYRVKKILKSAGGKGVNVARVAAILGGQVQALGFKAGDTGRWLEAQLQNLGVKTAFVEVEGETRTNCNIIDHTQGTETEVLEPGPWISSAAIEAFFEIFMDALHNTSVLVCSGGLPQGVPTGYYRTLIETANSRGIISILDTSGEVFREGIEARPFMVKPNLRELGGLMGQTLTEEKDIIKACKFVLSRGVKVVLASLGKQGALMVTADRVLRAKVPQVETVNTIGSGDATVAGCAVALGAGMPMEEVLRMGMACAVANTQFMEIGMVSVELVERFRKETVIERVE